MKAIDLLRKLEWSGRRQGPGTSMGASNGSWYKSCPLCHGLEKPNGDFDRSAVGHSGACELRNFFEEEINK